MAGPLDIINRFKQGAINRLPDSPVEDSVNKKRLAVVFGGVSLYLIAVWGIEVGAGLPGWFGLVAVIPLVILGRLFGIRVKNWVLE